MKGMIEEKKKMLYLWLLDNFDFFDEEQWQTVVMHPWALDAE